MKKKTIIITGISGSGGSYLAEHILSKSNSYNIVGLLRKISNIKGYNLKELSKNRRVKLLILNFDNVKQLSKIFIKYKPSYIFHFASNANVQLSFFQPYKIIKGNIDITLNILEAFRLSNLSKVRFVMCSTSEVYGDVPKKNNPLMKKLQLILSILMQPQKHVRIF